MTKVFFIMMFCTSLVYAQIPIDIQRQLNSKKNFLLWTKMYDNFRLSDFEKWEEREIGNDDIFDLDSNSISPPDYIDNLLIYSPNRKKRIDLHRELGIIKLKDRYYMDPGTGSYAFIQNIANRQDIVVYRGGDVSGIDEAVWLNNDEAVLLGHGSIFNYNTNESCDECTIIVYINFQTMKSISYASSKTRVSNREREYDSYIKIKRLKLEELGSEN